MKNFFIVLFNMIFINFAFALTPIEVKNDFKNEIGTLKVYPMINDGYSTKVNYLAANTQETKHINAKNIIIVFFIFILLFYKFYLQVLI